MWTPLTCAPSQRTDQVVDPLGVDGEGVGVEGNDELGASGDRSEVERRPVTCVDR